MQIINEELNAKEDFRLPSPTEYPDNAVLSIDTTGHYWRNSALTSLALIYSDGRCWHKKNYMPEKESDEYDILSALSTELINTRTLITFNGTAFLLPYIKNKCRSYELPDPFVRKLHRDLLREMKPFSALFQIPSCRIDDFRQFMGLSPKSSDVCVTLYMLGLSAYREFFKGGYTYLSSSADDDHLYFQLALHHPVPKKVSLHDEVFHLILDKDQAKISARIINGTLRLYYTDYENYIYLPCEGYAIHKSLASSVDKSRREKAVRENSFTPVKADEAFISDQTRLKSYLTSAIKYLNGNFN